MNILVLTNTFTPHIGGVARSVDAFTAEHRRQGHSVLVVAPVFEGIPEKESGIIRIPAIQKFNGSDFSVRLPIPSFLFPALDRFKPDIVHTHHPFLLGDTALRIAALRNVPLVFTHHTMYERYTHYVPGDSPAMKRFVIELSTGYANLCDAVVAPSESVMSILKERGVQKPIQVIPTGVFVERFATGDRSRWRRALNIPEEAFVVGHLGRLAPEKNLGFLTKAVADFVMKHERAHFLVVGSGPSKREIKDIFQQLGVIDRLHLLGILQAQELVDAYHCMDGFAFASQSETQGMVLAEAMAAGIPVVAVDAAGVREVIRDRQNGRLLPGEDVEAFSSALSWIASLSPDVLGALKKAAKETARTFSIQQNAMQTLQLYEALIASGSASRSVEESPWISALHLIEAEWELWVNRAHAARAAVTGVKREIKERP